MSLKAVLFDFNGVIINDEPIHARLIDDLLVAENLQPRPLEYNQVCLGRSDRACLSALLERRYRVVTDSYLTELIERKSQAYRQFLDSLEKLPIFPGIEDLIYKLRVAQLKMAVVSGALHSEVELVLKRAGLIQYFSAIVGGDEVQASKPAPEGYLLAVERLNQVFPSLQLQPTDCLVIEDTPAGIQAAKRAGMLVVGVANTYPFHMIQRQANWTVDYLTDLELDRVRQVYQQKNLAVRTKEC